MIAFHELKENLVFIYYTRIRQEGKQLIVVGSLLFITISTGIALHFVTQNNSLTTVTNANQPLSQAALLSSDTSGLKDSAKFGTFPSPTTVKPNKDPAKNESLQILEEALEATWKNIDALQESPLKTSLNDQAALVSTLLSQGEMDKAKPLLKSLILTSEQATHNELLSLTPPPSPTLTPTITPTPTPNILPEQSVASYVSTTINTEKGKFSVKIITVDLNMVRMMTVSANESDCNNDCPTKPLASYISENGAFAGINGTYFCPPDYAECASKKNSYDFPIFNSKLEKWINFQNLDWGDRAMIIQDQPGIRLSRDPGIERSYKVNHVGNDWSQGYYRIGETAKAAFVMAPGLLENGNVIVNQFPLTDKQKTKSAKVGLGFNNQTVYAVIAYNVTMEEFAYVFRALGATDALNLDSGGSTAMWYGNYKIGPGRSLPNAIVFVKK